MQNFGETAQQGWEPGRNGRRFAATGDELVRAAREQRHEHHQIRQREQPLFGLGASCFCRPRYHPQVTAAREVMQMIDANARQAGNFRVREDLLTRLDCNQREPR